LFVAALPSLQWLLLAGPTYQIEHFNIHCLESHPVVFGIKRMARSVLISGLERSIEGLKTVWLFLGGHNRSTLFVLRFISGFIKLEPSLW